MIPHTNADKAIAGELLRIDRSIWHTLSCIKEICSKLYLSCLLSNPGFSDYILETILLIEKEQGEIHNGYKSRERSEDKQTLSWLT